MAKEYLTSEEFLNSKISLLINNAVYSYKNDEKLTPLTLTVLGNDDVYYEIEMLVNVSIVTPEDNAIH